MKLSRKLIALLCICSMVTVLGGCKSNEQTEKTSTSSQSAAASSTADKSTSSTSTPPAQAAGKPGGNFQGGNGGGMIDKSSDTKLKAILTEVESKFKQLTYKDNESGKTFGYNLFLPDNYDSSKKYPLVLFITDSSVIGQDTKKALEQGYGAVIWATKEEQAKHPCIILAPEYPENILAGETGVTDYVPATLRLLKNLQDTYSIDSNKLYITGQSMGCMTSLYLNATNPNLFAASLYVDGQWDASILSPIEKQKFFYFAAGGDQKASTGMSEVKAMFDKASVAYTQTTLDAKASSDVINSGVQKLITESKNNNFLSWKTGSVLPDGVTSQGANEHMYSFDHAYQVSAVRDWLFAQSK